LPSKRQKSEKIISSAPKIDFFFEIGSPGVDVMITVFCDFRLILAKQKKVTIKFLQTTGKKLAKKANVFAEVLAKMFLKS
jgi:ribosome maturation factor RimP